MNSVENKVKSMPKGWTRPSSWNSLAALPPHPKPFPTVLLPAPLVLIFKSSAPPQPKQRWLLSYLTQPHFQHFKVAGSILLIFSSFLLGWTWGKGHASNLSVVTGSISISACHECLVMLQPPLALGTSYNSSSSCLSFNILEYKPNHVTLQFSLSSLYLAHKVIHQVTLTFLYNPISYHC